MATHDTLASGISDVHIERTLNEFQHVGLFDRAYYLSEDFCDYLAPQLPNLHPICTGLTYDSIRRTAAHEPLSLDDGTSTI